MQRPNWFHGTGKRWSVDSRIANQAASSSSVWFARLIKVTETGQVVYKAEKSSCQAFPDHFRAHGRVLGRFLKTSAHVALSQIVTAVADGSTDRACPGLGAEVRQVNPGRLDETEPMCRLDRLGPNRALVFVPPCTQFCL